MPRDLTDLMERATSSAPPEPHDAAAITSLAASRQRRRTAGIAAALAVTVIAVTGIGYGATRGHDTTPQPAGPWKYGETLDPSAAEPAGSLPGYRLAPWTVPSVQRFGSTSELAPLPTYRSIDAHGRLILLDLPSGHYPGEKPVSGAFRARLFDRPGRPPAKLQAPGGTVPGRQWRPTFTDDGRLLWVPSLPKGAGFHVTDLSGGGDIQVTIQTPDGQGRLTPENLWVEGDRYWYATIDQSQPIGRGELVDDLYSATFGHALVQIATDVVVTGESGGTVAWVTKEGQVMAETPETGSPFAIHVPFDQGCSLTPGQQLRTANSFAVGRSFIALTERCVSGETANDELLVFDLAGREIAHSTGLDAFHPAVAGDTILIGGYDPRTGDVVQLRYDLVTGSLVSLTPATKTQPLNYSIGAGDYVLWYDDQGGHVARIPQ